MITETTFKLCSSCKECQSLDQFPLNKCVKSGYDYKCKKCHRESWHKRKPPITKINHVYPKGWVLDVVTIREILRYDEEIGAFRWIVEHAQNPIGSIAGTTRGIDSDCISINGKRYRIDHLKAFWSDGVMPVAERRREGWMRDYECEWMKDIKGNAKDFDWSCVWKHESSKQKQRMKWASMTLEEKRERDAKRCKIKQVERKKNWKIANLDKVKKQSDLWRKNNPDKLRVYGRNSRRRSRQNPKLRSRYNLRQRFKCLMRTVKRGGATSFSKTIGCTTKDLAIHLESKFKRGMTWSNYGKHWHVDHIIPCAVFNHSDPKQVKQCWHWTNLQPLEADKNMAKSDTITNPQLSLCI